MQFLAAGWLTMLVGWLVLTIWLWRHERQTVLISSRLFWPSSRSSSRRSHERSRPPAWVLAALMSLLAIIFALSNPILTSKSPRITVVVDPHVSMSARSGNGSVASALVKRLEVDLKALRANVDFCIVVPGHAQAPSNMRDVDSIRWTAASTSPSVEQRCMELGRQGESTIVLSAQQLNLPTSAVRYAPESMNFNRAIVGIGASVEPRPQAMVTIQHPSTDIPFELLLMSNAQTVTRRTEPEQGSPSTTVFVDLPPDPGEWMEARIEMADGFSHDNSAYLVQTGGWPRVEVVGNIPRPAERLAAIFARARPASDRSESILFTSTEQIRDPAILFAPTRPLAEPQTVSLNLPWREVLIDSPVQVTGIASAMPDGFEVLSRLGEKPILAVKRAEPRQVWIGCDVDAFAQTPEWVAWMNALVDFLNPSGPPRWEQTSVDSIEANWAPVAIDSAVDSSAGVYRSNKGDLVAANMPVVTWAIAAADSRESLRHAIQRAKLSTGFHASQALSIAALSLGAFAGLLMAWRSHLDGRNAAT